MNDSKKIGFLLRSGVRLLIYMIWAYFLIIMNVDLYAQQPNTLPDDVVIKRFNQIFYERLGKRRFLGIISLQNPVIYG